MIHVLKTHSETFQLSWEDLKNFEVRIDDREPRFELFDRVYLQEWDPAAKVELPRYIAAVITSIVRGPSWGVQPGFVVLGLNDQVFRPVAWSTSDRAARVKVQSRTPGKEVA